MSTIAQAEALRAKVEAAVGPLADIVTLDGGGIKPQTRAAVIVQPPEIEFATFSQRDISFKLTIAAGPATQPLVAWERIDLIIDALEAAHINLKSGSPATLDLAGAGTLPAYQITLNPS